MDDKVEKFPATAVLIFDDKLVWCHGPDVDFHLSWVPGDDTITLNGKLTIEQLKQIVEFMEAKNG